MERFQTITSAVVPLPYKDIDTDMIIPARYLTGVTKEGYGEHLFESLRGNPELVFDKGIYKNAKILAAQANFGCGSSREHAVWALLDYGFRVIIAPSFADIFSSNSGKNGLLLVTLPEKAVKEILEEATREDFYCSVDLKAQTVTTSIGAVYNFPIDSFRKHCLLNGLDDLDYILEHCEHIEKYESLKDKSVYEI